KIGTLLAPISQAWAASLSFYASSGFTALSRFSLEEKQMKTLDDIRQDKSLQSQIHWDMKPRERIRRTGMETQEEAEQITKQLQERVGYYFYIDVRNLQPALYLYENYPDVSGRFVAEVTEIPEQMLYGAGQEACGRMETDGGYPIDASIKAWLKNQMA